MTVFRSLKKKHGIRSVKSPAKGVRCRKVTDHHSMQRFLLHWESNQKHAWPGQEWYTGIGLHYSKTCPVMPPSKQICGNDGRKDYQDTMSYDTEVFPGLLDGFGKFPMVRCKITCMSGSSMPAQISGHQSWHRDETPFEALRVVIPLASDMTYQFQLDNECPISLIPGNAYAFDQSRYHRVFSNGASNLDRIHLVLSFVTWFDRVGEGWEPSAFCGKIHPLDLFDEIKL